MNKAKWVSGMLAVALLAIAGCGKGDTVTAQRLPAAMDLAKFQQSFPSPTTEQQSQIAKACEGVRYGMYSNSLAALDKLAADPALTEPQKKAVQDLIEGIKQSMANPPSPPGR
jgi:hypothetical protein